MNSNLSDQIKNEISSQDISNFMKSSNIQNEKSKDSLGNKLNPNLNKTNLHSVDTCKTNVSVIFKEITSFVETILNIIMPEKLKNYDEFGNFYEENVRKNIIKEIKDITNEMKQLKDKEELSRQKNMVTIGLNTDIDYSKYINMNEEMKEMKEMMKDFSQINKELSSQVSNSQKTIELLKKEIINLTKYIKENNNNNNNISVITSETSRNITKNTHSYYSTGKKYKINLNTQNNTQNKDQIRNLYNCKLNNNNSLVKNLKNQSKIKIKSNNKIKILGYNSSKENVNSFYINNYKDKSKNNGNKK